MTKQIFKRTGKVIEQIGGITGAGFVQCYKSINAAKRESRKLQASGAKVIRGKK